MGYHFWEYKVKDKLYKIKSMEKHGGISKTYYKERDYMTDVHENLGKFVEIKKNVFVFCWSQLSRRVLRINNKLYDEQRSNKGLK